MTEPYTLIVGTKRYSSWSLRPWLVMKMAGLPFTEIVMKLRTPETSDKIHVHSPSRKVPALKVGADTSAFTVWDSLAICEFLGERHLDKQLWPRDAVARAEARSIVAEMHSGFAEVRRNLPMDFGRALPQPELDENTQKQVARIVEIWESVLTRSGRQGDYLFGPFGIADAFYAPVVSRFETYNITLPEASRAYAQRMLALGPMQEWRVASLEDNA